MIRSFLIVLSIGLLASCESGEEPKKKKPVPPPGTGEYSSLPQNRPPKWESTSRFGGMMPQSR